MESKPDKRRKRILTGDRPTAEGFHLGNYVGSLANRVKLQEDYDTFILQADLHLLTTRTTSLDEIQRNIRGMALDYLSVGLDPEEDALYGLYHGVPLPEREFNYGNALPDRIVLYQDVIEEDAADEPEIREIAQETVVHEVGHYFGLSDEEMEEWEAGGWRE